MARKYIKTKMKLLTVRPPNVLKVDLSNLSYIMLSNRKGKIIFLSH